MYHGEKKLYLHSNVFLQCCCYSSWYKLVPKSDGTDCEVCQTTNINFAPKSDGTVCEDCGVTGTCDDSTRCKSLHYK